MDFYAVLENRDAILRRDGGQCIYCLQALDAENFVIDHLERRHDGGNGYRNLVAACNTCNNRKGSTSPDDYVRSLYRERLIDQKELASRLLALESIRRGDVKPMII